MSKPRRPSPNTHLIKGRVIQLKIFPNNTDAPTFSARGSAAGTSAVDGVASVARTSAGKFTITLQDAYKALSGFHATFSSAADDVDLSAQAGAVSNLGTSTAATAVVKLKTGANNTDVAAAADTFISVTLTFEDSDA